MNSSQAFRKLIQSDCIPIVGAFNGLVARSIAQNGFKCCYVSGSSISMVSGQPDIGLVTLDNFCKTIKEVHFSSGLPVISDADTGFGEAEMCAKTVWEYFNSGAAALHLEDQQYPKRSGQLEGKHLVKIEEMQKKIEKSVEASKKCSNGDFLIAARTDARQVEGLDNVILRLKKYVDAGADMILPNGLFSKEEFDIVAKELKNYGPKGGPFLIANMIEFGVSPIIKLKDFKEMGYNCVLYPVAPLRVAMKAIDVFLDDFKLKGTQRDYVEKMQSRKELYELLHYTPGKEWYYPNPHSHEIEFPAKKKSLN